MTDEQADAVALLALVAGQDVEPSDRPGQWRIAHRIARDRIISTKDPQSRHCAQDVALLPRRLQSPHRGRARHRAGNGHRDTWGLRFGDPGVQGDRGGDVCQTNTGIDSHLPTLIEVKRFEHSIFMLSGHPVRGKPCSWPVSIKASASSVPTCPFCGSPHPSVGGLRAHPRENPASFLGSWAFEVPETGGRRTGCSEAGYGVACWAWVTGR